MQMTLSVRRIVFLLWLINGIFAVIAIAAEAAGHLYPDRLVTRTLGEFLGLDGDKDTWTWLSSFMLLLASFLLVMIWFNRKNSAIRESRYWLSLSLLFLAMSMDDVACIHERSAFVFTHLETSGIFHFKWIIFGIPFVVIVGLLYARFLWRLPRWVSGGLVLAGGLFVGGALGMEMYNSHLASTTGYTNLYLVTTCIEECMEQMGLLVFVHVLLNYLAHQDARFRVDFVSREMVSTGPAGNQIRLASEVGTSPVARSQI